MPNLGLLPATYIAIALTHFLIQFALAYYYRYSYKRHRIPPAAKVLVLIPGYREGLPEIRDTIASCVAACNRLPLGYTSRIVYIEDDAWSDRLAPLSVEFLGNPMVQIIACGSNLGKRHAQKVGYDWAVRNFSFYPDYVVTVDSDTRLDVNAILSLLQQMRSDTGAVTGNIAIHGAQNLLQKLIAMRYFLAFNQERASQSVFGEVLCCSGPLTAYRGAIWRDVMHQYVNQKFMGKRCTFGDDRHLTSLFLGKGVKTRYDYQAVCWTDAPATLPKYLKQQTRWCKSFFRESLLMFADGLLVGDWGVRWYSIWESIVAIALPFLLLANLILLAVYQWGNPQALLWYLLTICCVAWGRSLYGIQYDNLNKKRWYILFPAFAVINLVCLVPIRLYALVTLLDSRWGTR